MMVVIMGYIFMIIHHKSMGQIQEKVKIFIKNEPKLGYLVFTYYSRRVPILDENSITAGIEDNN